MHSDAVPTATPDGLKSSTRDQFLGYLGSIPAHSLHSLKLTCPPFDVVGPSLHLGPHNIYINRFPPEIPPIPHPPPFLFQAGARDARRNCLGNRGHHSRSGDCAVESVQYWEIARHFLGQPPEQVPCRAQVAPRYHPMFLPVFPAHSFPVHRTIPPPPGKY